MLFEKYVFLGKILILDILQIIAAYISELIFIRLWFVNFQRQRGRRGLYELYMKFKIPYRANLCLAKVTNFFESDENFADELIYRRKFRFTKFRRTR